MCKETQWGSSALSLKKLLHKRSFLKLFTIFTYFLHASCLPQRAKKVVTDSPGLVDFAIRLVNSVLNLPDGQVKFFEEFKLQKNCEINLLIKTFLGLVEMMFGLVNVSFSLPEWKAVKMTFFAPCYPPISPGYYTRPMRNRRQWLCKILGH